MKKMFLTVVLCVIVSHVAAAESYRHPGGAWTITPPEGWVTHAEVDPRGYPVHLLTPDLKGDVKQTRQGILIFAVPIPTDESLEGPSVASLVSGLVKTSDPDLIFTDPPVPSKLGSEAAVAMDVSGRRAVAGPTRGRMLVSIEEEQFLVVMYFAPPGDWEAFRPVAERALTTFEGMREPPPQAEAPKPAQPEKTSDIAEKLRPSVPLLQIMVKPKDNPDDLQKAGWGSGFIITENGYLITNRHVVNKETTDAGNRESFDPLVVAWDVSLNLPPATADVVAISYKEDLALLKIRGDQKFSPIPFADARKVRQGDAVAVLGWPNPNSLGESDMNINQGTLAAVEHDKRGHISAMRHSARTTGGNSGGPLYDLELGGVIGAHNMSIATRRGDIAETLTFRAVPADWIVREFPQVAAAGPHPKLKGTERDALVAYYFLQERFGAATIEAQNAMAENPLDGVAAAYLARMYTLLGSPSLAKTMLKIALDHPDSEFLGAILGARTAVEIDDYKTGLDLASRAVRLKPHDPDAHVVMGHVYAGMGRWDQARKEYKEALSLSGDLQAEAHGALGCIAIAEWMMQNEIITIPPRVAPPAQLVAEAKASLNRSLELWPAKNYPSHCCLALIAGLEGKQNEISPRLNRCLAAAGHNDPDAKLGVATVLLMMGDFERANGFVEQAREVRESAHAVFLNGWVSLSAAADAAKQGKNDLAGKLAQDGAKKYLIAAQMSPDAAWAPAAIKVGQIFYTPR